MFISCGTWSILGVFTNEVILNEDVYKKNLTNELTYKSKNTLMKNITGLYVLEKFKNELENKINRKITFDEITDYVKNDKNKAYIDIDKEEFGREDISKMEALKNNLILDNKDIPDNYMGYFTIIYNSLINKYKETISEIENVMGKSYKKITVIGGGANSEIILKKLEESSKKEVIKGPTEASVLGNIILQLLSKKEISSIEEGIILAKNPIEIQ